MSVPKTLVVALLLGLTAGCSSLYDQHGPRGRSEMWTTDAIRAASLNRALVVQAAVFPYHFTTRTAELNELGRRDLDILARHYVRHAGQLSVRRGDADETLYQARVDAVLAALSRNGVGRGQITVTDAWPGGQGMASQRLLVIMADPTQAAAAPMVPFAIPLGTVEQ